MVAATGEHNEWLQGALGADADRVRFIDMIDLGRNPVRIIPALREFVEEGTAGGGAVRGIGEPIWRGRRPAEVLESQLSEALINVAVEPDSPVWLMCPYEADSLDPALIDEVYRSHPAVIDGSTYRGSPSYGGRAHLDEVFTADLPPLTGLQGDMVFERNELHQVSKLVAATAFAVGVAPDRAAELAVVVKELAASSLQRGARVGQLRIYSDDAAVVCEIRDDVVLTDPMSGRRPATPAQRHAGWLTDQRADLVQLRSNERGTTVRVHHWL